jgi:hypothetical protein
VDSDILGSTLGVLPDYLIRGSCSGGWGRVSGVYSLGVGLKCPALVRFHVIKKKKKEMSEGL